MRNLQQLNQLVRRLRQYRTESEWASAVLDGASQFAEQVALFLVENGNLHLRAQRNLNLDQNLSFSSATAAAFQNAIASRDSVIALRTASEVTEALSAGAADERAYVAPIENGPRVVALLFVAGKDAVDLSGIELIASIASMVLERQSNKAAHTQIAVETSEQKVGASYSGQLV